MTNALSKSNEAESASERRKRRALLQAKRLIFMNVAAWLMMIPARPEMVLRVTAGDSLKASRLLGMMTAGAGLFEFAGSALFGRVSDKYGRKSVLLVCASVSSLFRFVDFLLCDGGFSRVMVANWMDRLFAGACFPAAFTIISAMVSDVVLGQDLARHSGSIAAYAGLGVIVGPVLGAKVMQWTGSPKYCCLCASALSALMATYLAFGVEETLKDERPIDWAACNPFSFLKLLRGGRVMATLCAATLLERAVRDMHDVKMVLLKTKLNFSTTGIAQYMLGTGLQVVVGGVVGKALVERSGALGSSLVGGVASIANLASWGFARSPRAIAFALLCDTFAGCRSLSATAALTTLAVRSGIGRGEVAGMLANLANVTKIVCPFAYTLLYSRFGQLAPFVVASAAVAASQGILLTLDEASLSGNERAHDSKKENKEE